MFIAPCLGRSLRLKRANNDGEPLGGCRRTGPVFCTRDGKRLKDRNVRRVLDSAGKRAGLEWVHFHTFRHTCVSVLFDSGRNIRQVRDWLGHSDPAFTLRTYVHLMDGGLGAADFLDAAVGNVWATQHPETAANDRRVLSANMAG